MTGALRVNRTGCFSQDTPTLTERKDGLVLFSLVTYQILNVFSSQVAFYKTASRQHGKNFNILTQNEIFCYLSMKMQLAARQ